MKKINKILTTHGQWLLLLTIVFYIILFAFISLWKYYNFGYDAMDLAIINQVFYNSSLGNFFASSIHPPTYLGDHFTPILFLLLPFYFLWLEPPLLLILQTIILALSAWPIYLIARKVLTKNWSLILAIAWLVNPFVQNINLFEFHFLPLAIFFILWAFYFFQNQKIWLFAIFSALALLVREDVALTIFMFGLIAVWQKRKIRWWLTPFLSSLIYFLLAIKITSLLVPAGQYKFSIYYSWLVSSLTTKPWLILTHLFQPGNWELIIALLLPLVFLPLISPFYLILGLGTFLQLILRSGGGSATLLETHYASLLLPAVFIAAIYSIKKITNNNSGQQKIISLIKKYEGLAKLIFAAGLIYFSLTLGPIVGSFSQITQPSLPSTKNLNKKEILEKIPKNASVAATYEMLTPLSSRPYLYSFNYIFLGKQQFLTEDYSLPDNTEYLIIDFQDLITYQLQYGNNPFYQNHYRAIKHDWQKVLANFGLIEIKDNLALYQKGAENKFTLVKLLDDQPEITQPRNDIFNKKIKFLGFNKTVDFYQLFWQMDLPLEKNYQLELVLTKDDQTIYQKLYPLAYDLLPNEPNLGKKNIQTNYWFELPKNISIGVYELKIRLIEILSGGVEMNSIRGTKNVIDEKTQVGPEILLKTITQK